MAGAQAIPVVLGFAKEACTFAQQTALKWYKASDEIERFKVRSGDLKRRAKDWDSLLHKYNMDDSEIGREIRSRLNDASERLKKENDNINALRSQCLRRWCTKLVFPEELTSAMDNLYLAFEELPQRLKDQATVAELLDKSGLRQRKPLRFLPDKKYVQFKATTAAVQSALESEDTGPVVTLWGGPGQGKTSMAKHLALFYQNEVVEGVLPVENSTSKERVQNSAFRRMVSSFNCCGSLYGFLPQDVSVDANPPANGQKEALLVQQSAAQMKTFPDGVFFYYCGPNAKSDDILLELCDDLGYESLHPMTQAGMGESDGKQESSRSQATLKELNRRLANKKILIVLDDVWESRVVEELLMEGVKFLVTTQKHQLWGEAEIPIRSPTLEEEYDILRKYIPGFPKEFTPQLKGAIDSFIMKSFQNPLILANMATSRKDVLGSRVKEWEAAAKHLEKLLVNDEEVQVQARLFNLNYSTETMRASTTMAFDSMPKEQQILLFVASICEAQSIPEVVFKTFFKKCYDNLDNFTMASHALQQNNFLKFETKIVSWSDAQSDSPRDGLQKSWIIHSMRQKVIASIKAKDIASLVDELLERYEEEKMVVMLLAVFGQEYWRDQATSKLINSNQELGKHHGSTQFSTIRPFVWLLQVDCEDELEKESNCLVEQVFHKYLLEGVLDDSSLCRLLQMPETVSPTVEALSKMEQLTDTPIFTIGHPKTAEALLNVVECVSEDERSMNAAHNSGWLLSKISFEGLADTNNATVLQLFPNVVERLSARLAKDVFPHVQKSAAGVLGYLFWQTSTYPIDIAFIPVTVQRLVALLAVGISLDVQENAALTLGNLSSKLEGTATEIAACHGAVDGLVTLLAKDVSPQVQQNAAYALRCLCEKEAEVAIQIAASPGAIDRLVALLAKDASPPVQEHAAWALGILSFHEAEIAIKIAACSGAIDGLVALLTEDESAAVQDAAAWALAILSRDVGEAAIKIAACLGGIDRLAALLAKDVSPEVQENAAYALGCLSEVEVEVALKIAAWPGVVDGLLALLAEDVSAIVQGKAALALNTLSMNVGDIDIKIAACPGAIHGLVALFAENGSPTFKQQIALALGRLSRKDAETAMRIPSCPGGIDGLVAFLAEDVNPGVQRNAALALGSISSGAVEIANQIASFPDAIERLVAMLANDRSAEIQSSAAFALGKICSDIESRVKVASLPGALERLDELLSKHDVEANATLVLGEGTL